MAFEDAISVESIGAERAYVTAHPCACGGAWHWQQQALLFSPEKKPFDRIMVQCQACKKSSEFWFDVSSFFGKPAW